MDEPTLISGKTFQEAWIKAANYLKDNNWDVWNLVVQISDPTSYDKLIHNTFKDFAVDNDRISPKGVAYTIFPHKLYNRVKCANKLYSAYMDKIYTWTRKRKHKGWGTYFQRMIAYPGQKEPINQLANIIDAINNRDRISRASYTIVIEKPGGETIRPLGAPCLNYIAVQIESDSNAISLLCVYRNHDFFERAYGNYWGMCNLLCFIANETKLAPGSVTCISSHAYINGSITNFKAFLEALNEA
jgi:thymidylate synthase